MRFIHRPEFLVTGFLIFVPVLGNVYWPDVRGIVVRFSSRTIHFSLLQTVQTDVTVSRPSYSVGTGGGGALLGGKEDEA